MTVPRTNSSSLGIPSGVGCRKKTSSTSDLPGVETESIKESSQRLKARRERGAVADRACTVNVHMQARLGESKLAQQARRRASAVSRTGSRRRRREVERVIQALVGRVVEPFRVTERSP